MTMTVGHDLSDSFRNAVLTEENISLINVPKGSMAQITDKEHSLSVEIYIVSHISISQTERKCGRQTLSEQKMHRILEGTIPSDRWKSEA